MCSAPDKPSHIYSEMKSGNDLLLTNGKMHHRVRQGVHPGWFVRTYSWKLIFVAGDDNELWQGPALLCLIPSFVPQSGGRIASHTLGQINVGRFVGLGYILHRNPASKVAHHNGQWKWIVAIRSKCSIDWNYLESLRSWVLVTSNFLWITMVTCSRLCYR